MELYKKYRPKSLKRMVGNKITIATLKNMIERKTIPHTILFEGLSGGGKTTFARILKKALGCSDLDFTELNCSTNRGIDTIRDIEHTMTLAPAAGKSRIYLMDEVHQLSKDAQHGSLKMFEDTPDHVYFILCTTEPQKLLKTVRNRCYEMSVEPLDEIDMEILIKRVCKLAKIEISKNIMEDLIDASEGSARKCLVLLDKIRNLPDKERGEALAQGEEEEREGIELCKALINKKSWNYIAKLLKELKGEPESIRWSVMGFCRGTILRGKNHHAFHVLTCFENHFFDSKRNGLARASYESVHGEI